MLLAYFQLCFAVLLTAICDVQPLVPSQHNTVLHGLNDETRCRWNCTTIDSDSTEEMKSTIAKKKSARLVVKYEKKVDNKCVTQTSGNSSGKGQIWLINKQLSSFAGVLESLANLMSFADSNEEYEEIRAICILRPAGPTATIDPEYNSGIQFSMFSQGHLFGIDLNSTDCNTGDTDNSNRCIDITNSTGNNSAYSTSPFKPGGWPVGVFYCFCIVFVAVFVHYSPALLCLLSSTEVIEHGVRLIILEGASPVSVRSVMGNYFFSEDDGTVWHKARTFVFRAVIMPLPFLGLGISDFSSYTFQKYIMICSGCYFIQACYISFFALRSIQAKPCYVCKLVKPKIFSCGDELPQLIEGHLRLQPLILLECFKLFNRCIVRYFKMSLMVLPSWKLSVVQLLRFFIFVVFLSIIPAVAVVLFIVILFLALIGIAFSSPIVILCKARYTGINVPYFVALVIRCFISVEAISAVVFLVLSAALGTLRVFLRGLELLFSDDSLPYVACFVLVIYYVWSTYSSFTNKYQDLAFALFMHYKKSRDEKIDARALNSTDQVLENIGAEYEDNSMKIPKQLFLMACEELMPIRENVCVLVLKVTIILSFVFLVFSIAILTNVGATPVMKALLTLLTGIFPKIVAIYIDGGRQRKIEAMITDQRIPKILREYFKKASKSCQGHDNYGAGVNETSQNVNEQNIELIIM